ncbi:MAG: glycerol-3-phosphate 1-O-acyltransferase PlsY [Acidobacteriota bacterium]
MSVVGREVALVGAYLLGSIPFAYLLVRAAGKGDIRRAGSGNVGATNSLRAAGWKVAGVVLVLDVGKGLLAVWAMRQATGSPAWSAAAALAAVIGHCFPVWLGFRGGKGVATLVGSYALVAPLALAVTAVVWLVACAVSRVVAVGSLVAAATLPIAVYVVARPSPGVVGCTVATSLVVLWRHRENLARLVRGEEPRIGKGGRG